MPVTMQDVIRQLDREEPDYTQAARLGEDALPHLRELVQGSNIGLAAKAACLAGVINAGESVPVLELAARHADPVVRVAAAASAKNLTEMTVSLATSFLEDVDAGVRKWGLRSLEVKPLVGGGIQAKVEKIMKDDPEVGLREQARLVVDRLR